MCGKTPSSRPVRNTTGNSRPFALCSVIIVTTSPSGVGEDVDLGDQRRALEEVGEPRRSRLPARGRASNSSATPASSWRFSTRLSDSIVSFGLERREQTRVLRRRTDDVGQRRTCRVAFPDQLEDPREVERTGARWPGQSGHLVRSRERFGERDPAARSRTAAMLLDRALSDAALRRTGGAQQRDAVRGVVRGAQVRERVRHLAAVVELQAADDAVRDPVPDERSLRARGTARSSGRRPRYRSLPRLRRLRA